MFTEYQPATLGTLLTQHIMHMQLIRPHSTG